jgi:uncharacterized membrane protein
MQATANNTVIGWTLAGATALWATLIVAAPYLAQLSGGVAAVLYAVGGLICHQLPERSFHLVGAQLPVCARCLGLYAGGAAGALWWMVRVRHRERPWRREQALVLLACAAIPTAVTAGAAMSGMGDPANAWRAALAAPLGFAGGRIVAAVATNHLK